MYFTFICVLDKIEDGGSSQQEAHNLTDTTNKTKMPFSQKFTVAFRADAIDPNAKNVVKLFQDKTLSNFAKWPVINVNYHLMAVTYKSIPMGR
jgi:hypothetical protein